ncbi:response regulator transcription factor [Sulfurimonas sp.]|uniref:response regulator transcription factor n=1 Tax=Sulfurimonas sp. TaxID=2022749 RepID=UPI0025FDFD67|nr:response regulator transcription factor [Sulfurimonas sp.]
MYEKVKELLINKNILIVEDEIDLRDIMFESIQEYVNEIFVAKNGLQGLELFQEKNIDLIISDIHMAKMTGLRMSHEIRKFDPFIPIIFLTAYDTDKNMLEAIEVKSRSVLKKPFDKKQLLVSMMLAMNSFKEEFTLYNLSHGYEYNADTKELILDKKIISLTKKEQRLLELLLKHKEHSVSFSLIENYVWMENGATPDAIRMFINKLRKKIYPELIQNIQGIGYKLTIK